MRIHVLLYHGQWRRSPTANRLHEQLRRFFGDDLRRVEFSEPDDSDVAVDAVVFASEGSDLEKRSVYCDCLDGELYEALVRWMEPEYDTMLEVEVSDV